MVQYQNVHIDSSEAMLPKFLALPLLGQGGVWAPASKLSKKGREELNGELLREQFLPIPRAASSPGRLGDGDCGGGRQPAPKEFPTRQPWLRALDCKPLLIVIGVLPIFKGISIP